MRAAIATAPSTDRHGFTLIELLVVVGVIGVLLGVLLPALGAARASSHAVACASNLRQMAVAASMYAQDNDGRSPALGAPWGAPPFWALVVLQWSERPGDSAAQLYTPESILVCPAAQAAHPGVMERTYAINVTGHAGLEGDPDDFDEGQVHIRMDRVRAPSRTPLFLDSETPTAASDGPPPTRTASVLDFRQPAHVLERLGRVHAGAPGAFQAAQFDASVTRHRDPAPAWRTPLP